MIIILLLRRRAVLYIIQSIFILLLLLKLDAKIKKRISSIFAKIRNGRYAPSL